MEGVASFGGGCACQLVEVCLSLSLVVLSSLEKSIHLDSSTRIIGLFCKRVPEEKAEREHSPVTSCPALPLRIFLLPLALQVDLFLSLSFLRAFPPTCPDYTRRTSEVALG